MRKPQAIKGQSADYTQTVGLFAPKNKSNGCSNAKCLILPNFAVGAKSKESRKSLIFRILPRIAFACCGPTCTLNFKVTCCGITYSVC